MINHPNRRTFLGMLMAGLVAPDFAWAGERKGNPRQQKNASDEITLPSSLAELGVLSAILGRATGQSAALSLLTNSNLEAEVEYGVASEPGNVRMEAVKLMAGVPREIELKDLQGDAECFYRLSHRRAGEAAFGARREATFHTRRAAGSSFVFCVQGDSHPERPGMFDPELYATTLRRAAADKPDFFFCMGDDFSIEKLREYTAQTVNERYALQRPFLGIVAGSACLALVNGNHEQASLYNYNQSGNPHLAAVLAQKARNQFFPMPAPDGFYSGDEREIQEIGLPRDYYAWTWGDALFVVLDNYWHSPALVDNLLGAKASDENSDKRNRDWWAITLGERQYAWLKKTLEGSKAKYKFVFAHHVLGTGRGGVEESSLYEWGGMDRRGVNLFAAKRPNWELPIHQLMVRHKVSVFFHGHDHLYAYQERDGVVYQQAPIPADASYVAYNEDRYASGVKRPNSGYLRVTVTPLQTKVEYVRCYLSKDENGKRKTGEIAHGYAIDPG